MSKFNCHCIVHVYNGIKTLVSKQTITVEAENKEEAKSKVRKDLEMSYRKRTDCGLSSIIFASVDEISMKEKKEVTWSEDMDIVSGLASQFNHMDEFIYEVKRSYKEYTGKDCDIENIVLQACVLTDKGLDAETITPLVDTDIIIQNWYTCEVSRH